MSQTRRRRSFSPEFKTQRVLELISGSATPAELSRKHELSAQLLLQWKQTFLQKASIVFESDINHNMETDRMAQLEQTLGKLTLENEILKKGSLLSIHQTEKKW